MSPPGDSRKTVQESRRNLKTRHPELARCKRAGEGPNVGPCYQCSLAAPNLVRLGAQLCFDYAEWNASHMRSLSRPLCRGRVRDDISWVECLCPNPRKSTASGDCTDQRVNHEANLISEPSNARSGGTYSGRRCSRAAHLFEWPYRGPKRFCEKSARQLVCRLLPAPRATRGEPS